MNIINKGVVKSFGIVVCIVYFLANVGSDRVLAVYEDRTVSSFWRSDFVPGVAVQGRDIIVNGPGSYGIGTSMADATLSDLVVALNCNEMILIHSHGAKGLITLSPSVTVRANFFSSIGGVTFNSGIVYLSCCQSGATSDTYGNICEVMINKGADVVVAFEKNISASSSTNGIHAYNRYAVTYLSHGYTVERARHWHWKIFMRRQGSIMALTHMLCLVMVILD